MSHDPPIHMSISTHACVNTRVMAVGSVNLQTFPIPASINCLGLQWEAMVATQCRQNTFLYGQAPDVSQRGAGLVPPVLLFTKCMSN